VAAVEITATFFVAVGDGTTVVGRKVWEATGEAGRVDVLCAETVAVSRGKEVSLTEGDATNEEVGAALGVDVGFGDEPGRAAVVAEETGVCDKTGVSVGGTI
jgi:hypothetical protein